MFARASVCNAFLPAKVWYVLQVLHSSRDTIQRIHRVFVLLIWSSTWERTSRTNLFRRVKDGGLGLSHLFVRQLVNRFCFVRDQKDLLLRSVIQVRLSRALPEFIVLSDIHSSYGIRGFSKEVVSGYGFFAARFSLEYLSNVSRKRLTKDLIVSLFLTPLYRSLYSAESGQDILKRVKQMRVPAFLKFFFFKLHSETLPVQVF